MKMWRKKLVPRLPTSLDEYVNLINSEAWREKYTRYDGGDISVTCLRANAGSKVAVFADLNYLRSLQVENFHVDGTFAVCSRRPRTLQLVIIMATIDDTVLPIAWALTERKNVATYLALLRYFKNIAAIHWRPKTFTIDFEQALSSAIRMVYPRARIIRCFFHYCQGRAVRDPPARQYVIQDAIIARAWELYDDGVLNNEKFLTATSHFL
ncbi:uncharacterized protein LOC107046368 [Diachasma alloeum]|uniref:uncharacterized protein LOC107046368 n=1 Tax=Diachasma alloeum TaxID=454923 RepID=UPI00073825FF|nr:uncharacterized protein LOC107046368 [Diachasma alloeum]